MGNYSSEVINLAIQTQTKYGVPASVTLAQYALESGYGTSYLAKNANNYFGITGSYNGQSVTRNGRSWRSYDSMAESFDDHGRLLSTDLYRSKTQGTTNVYDYIRAFSETYAPSSDGNIGYADKLISIIQRDNLMQYDDMTAFDYSTEQQLSTQQMGWFSDKKDDVLSAVIRFVAIVFLVVAAVVFFMIAFDIKAPTPTNAIKKAVAE